MNKKIFHYITILLLLFFGHNYWSASNRYKFEQKATSDVMVVENCKRYSLSKKIPVILFNGKLSKSGVYSVVSYTADKIFREKNNFPPFYIDTDRVCGQKNKDSISVWVFEDFSVKIKGTESVNIRVEIIQKRAIFWKNIFIAALVIFMLILLLWKK